MKREIEKIRYEKSAKILTSAMVCCMVILVCALGVTLLTRNNGGSKESLAGNVGQTSEIENDTELETMTTQTESTDTESEDADKSDYHYLVASADETYPEIATSEDQYKTIEPENRDVETDPSEIVALKEEIRENGYYVLHCFKDRLAGREIFTICKH